MRTVFLLLAVCLIGACASTGGDIVGPTDESITPGNAVIAFSVQIADDTRFQLCSVFVGRSPSSAKWFGWSVTETRTTLFALEVPTPDYGFFRFGCVYRGLSLSTSSDGPELNLQAGDVVYLGRLVVDDTEYGTAAGHSRMPSAVRLRFEDHSEADIEDLKSRLPLFASREVTVNIIPSWGATEINRLRPYKQGPRVLLAPVPGAWKY